MRISEALRGVALLGVETSPFIYFVEQHPVYVGRMRDVFRRVDEGNPRIVTSVITLTEILVLPIETGNQAYEQAYREMLLNIETIRLERVSVAIAEQAARLRRPLQPAHARRAAHCHRHYRRLRCLPHK